MKLKTYKFDKDLTDAYLSYKIDGVQAVRKNNTWRSRADKPLYNLPNMPDGIYEVFLGDWASSVSAVRTHEGVPISEDKLYSLLWSLDPRLEVGFSRRMTPSVVRREMELALERGYEGLCIVSDQGHFKVKPKVTYDVLVTGVTEGTGKHLGKMGAMITDMGKVGTGLTDAQRAEFTEDSPIGKIIEVEAMELTPSGKFRHPRFVRLRTDK